MITYTARAYSPGCLRIINNNLVVVSPDIGGIKLARSYATRLHCGLVVIDKRRPKQNQAEVVHIIGNVENKDVLLVDDLIDTAGTLVSAIEALKKMVQKIFIVQSRIRYYRDRRWTESTNLK